MRINWKIRFKNKAFLISFVSVILGFIYQVLGLFDVVPKITQDNIMQIIIFVVNLLVGLGVIVDPTTKGVNDSDRAMGYE